MKQFLDFLPLLVFFVTYKLQGIYTATAALLVVSIVFYGGLWLRDRTLERGQWITLGAVVIFGSLTLLLHDVTWIKWKAPVVNGILALVFASSRWFGQRTVIEHLMGDKLPTPLPAIVWQRLNTAWVGFFIVCGVSNWYVAFHYDAIWVDFKVLGTLAMTLVFIVLQMFYLARHIQSADTDSTQHSTASTTGNTHDSTL